MDCKGKKILFVMTKMNNMENEIISEMEKQGATVDFFDDPMCFESDSSAKDNYWKTLSKSFKKYDIFFCIDGYSFSPVIIDEITKNNPDVYKILYLWDDMLYYDWSQEFKYFDKISSFEEDDCKKFGLNYLPLYWVSYTNLEKEKIYDLSYIGAFTEDRVKIIDSILPFIKNYNYKINLVRPRNTSFMSQIKRIVKVILRYKDKQIQRDYILDYGIDKTEFDKITASSKCVLDIVKVTQKGFTNRSMQTIGNGIKLISTNKNIKNAPFYDSEMIYIFDSDNINGAELLKFIEKPLCSKLNDYINNLEISNWIKRL